MNPYAPTEIKSTEADDEDAVENKTSPRLWPLMLLNVAFMLCTILVVALPGLGSWLLVSVLVVCSIGGWTLALSLQQE